MEKAREHWRIVGEIRAQVAVRMRGGLAAHPALPDDLRSDDDQERRAPRLAAPQPLVDKSGVPDDPAACVTVVAGLPRSGTSMMMQMLAAGGLPILSDGRRAADSDNPRGYLELEAATRLRQDREWMREAKGRAVKIVAQLLPQLLPDLPYRVVFMEREPTEVLCPSGKAA